MKSVLKIVTNFAVFIGTMRRKLCVFLAVLSIGAFYNLKAADTTAATDDLPPVPFIIGGDDAIAPAKANASGPLLLPEEKNKAPAVSKDAPKKTPQALVMEDTPEDLSDVTAAAAKAPAIPAPVANTASTGTEDLDGPLPMVLPEPAAKPVGVAKATEATPIPVPAVNAQPTPMVVPTPAPVAVSAVPAPQTEFAVAPPLPVIPEKAVTEPTVASNALPPTPAPAPVSGVVQLKPLSPSQVRLPELPKLQEPPKQPTTIGADGVAQIKGVEHVVGRDNKLLPPVELTPAVAAVGEHFPELHVDQIPLEDLLAYLKDYTPRSFRYELPAPLYVTLDLKPRSVEEVMQYLVAHYPIDITSDANVIYVRPGVAKPIAQAQASQPQPQIPAMTPRYSALSPQMHMPAGRPRPVVYPQEINESRAHAYYTPSVSENWDQVRLKARLYELQKERDALLKERRKLDQKVDNYDLDRRED